MSEYSDLEDMIDALILAICREESEEQFFRRSGEASENEMARKMFLEIADEMAALRRSLEARREELLRSLRELRGRPQ